MGLFSNIGAAKTSAGGVYVLPGAYKLQVLKIASGKTRNGKPFFVAEFKILESNNDERKPGTTMSWMVMLDQNQETGLGNIKGFITALFGIPDEEVDEAGVETLCSPENPGRDRVILASASNIKTRAGKDFTKVAWTHVE